MRHRRVKRVNRPTSIFDSVFHLLCNGAHRVVRSQRATCKRASNAHVSVCRKLVNLVIGVDDEVRLESNQCKTELIRQLTLHSRHKTLNQCFCILYFNILYTHFTVKLLGCEAYIYVDGVMIRYIVGIFCVVQREHNR